MKNKLKFIILYFTKDTLNKNTLKLKIRFILIIKNIHLNKLNYYSKHKINIFCLFGSSHDLVFFKIKCLRYLFNCLN